MFPFFAPLAEVPGAETFGLTIFFREFSSMSETKGSVFREKKGKEKERKSRKETSNYGVSLAQILVWKGLLPLSSESLGWLLPLHVESGLKSLPAHPGRRLQKRIGIHLPEFQLAAAVRIPQLWWTLDQK